jgi:hypothetical protein
MYYVILKFVSIQLMSPASGNTLLTANVVLSKASCVSIQLIELLGNKSIFFRRQNFPHPD